MYNKVIFLKIFKKVESIMVFYNNYRCNISYTGKVFPSIPQIIGNSGLILKNLSYIG